MLRYSTAFYKLNLKEIDIDLYIAAYIDDNTALKCKCDNCGARAHFKNHGRYIRGVIIYKGGIIHRYMHARRVRCRSCGKTHSIIPELIIAGKTYSVLFILKVLKTYFKRDMPVLKLCEKFEISVSTLYRWKDEFKEHRKLYLGVLRQVSEAVENFFRESITAEDLSEIISSFREQFGVNFMERFPDTS